MARSPEYPDLPWMPPKSYTKGRRPGCPRVVVIHTTEGSERRTSAEDGAAYDQRRTDGTSTHYFHDADSTVQCVRTTDEAHAARQHGNDIGIQHEICGKAGQTAAQWADAASQATIRRVARQVARDCRKWHIPVVRLTPAQVDAGKSGICGHYDVTRAFPEDDGTHTDPGSRFPWDQLLALVRAELEGDDMPTAKEIAQETVKAVWLTDNVVQAPWTVRTDDNPYWAPGTILHHGLGHAIQANGRVAELLTKVDGLTALFTSLVEAGGGNVDTAAVLSKLNGLASQVGDLEAKLAAAQLAIADRDARLSAALADHPAAT